VIDSGSVFFVQSLRFQDPVMKTDDPAAEFESSSAYSFLIGASSNFLLRKSDRKRQNFFFVVE
jgi:hypothetical protein